MGAILKEFIDMIQHSKYYPGYSKDKIRREARELVYITITMRHSYTAVVGHSREIKNILDRHCNLA